LDFVTRNCPIAFKQTLDICHQQRESFALETSCPPSSNFS
jgi:hypothetical protein